MKDCQSCRGLGLTTRPGINRAGTGLPMAGIRCPRDPQAQPGLCLPGWVMNQVLPPDGCSMFSDEGPCPEMGSSLASLI